MGRKTPARIKQKVLKLWLSGLPRDEIAQKVETSQGNINTIVRETKKDIPDIDLLRELSVRIRKSDWDQDIFSSAVRHRNMLYERGLTDEQIDDTIENIDEHCFKRGITFNSFVELVQNASLFSQKYSCSIEEIDAIRTQKEDEVERLKTEARSWRTYNESLKSTTLDILTKHNVTELDMTEYIQDKPLRKKTRELRQENVWLQDRVKELKQRWYVVSSVLPKDMTVEVVEKAVKLLALNPTEFEKLIKYILKKEPTLERPSRRVRLMRYSDQNRRT